MEIIHVKKEEALMALLEVEHLLSQVEEATELAGKCFIDLAFVLLQVKKGAFWTERGYNSEHEYIDKAFPQSRAQYYALIRFATYLGGYGREELKSWGRSKCEDLVRLHLHFNGMVPEEWFKHLDEDTKDTFRRRVRAFLDAKDEKEVKELKEKEPTADPATVEANFVTIKLYGNAIHTVQLAADTMAKIAGTDKSLGHRIELICANFNSQFTEDGDGHVAGKNTYILSTIEGLIRQLDFAVPDTSERLIGIVAKGVESNVATQETQG